MKITKTASNFELKMSQKDWEAIGKKAGWLVEAGMGTVSAQCSQCQERQFVSRYNWNSGKAKCKFCGGMLDEVAPLPKKAPPVASPMGSPSPDAPQQTFLAMNIKLVKTANGIEIKMSKKEWQEIGKKAQWSQITEEDRYRDLLNQNEERLDAACERAAKALEQQGVTPEYFVEWVRKQSVAQDQSVDQSIDQQFAQQQDMQDNQISLESDNLDRQPNIVAQTKEAGWLNTQTICPKCRSMLRSDNGFSKGVMIKCPNCRMQFDASRHAPPKKKIEAPVEAPEQDGFLSNNPFKL